MKTGYAVLYVRDGEASLDFWTRQVGMVKKSTQAAAGFQIHKVGFADQDFAFELVPIKMMENNPDNLNLGTPSICFYTDNLAQTRQKLIDKNVKVSEIMNHFGMETFAFSDNEDHWFAMTIG